MSLLLALTAQVPAPPPPAPAPAPSGGGSGGGGGFYALPAFYAERIPAIRNPIDEDEALLIAVIH